MSVRRRVAGSLRLMARAIAAIAARIDARDRSESGERPASSVPAEDEGGPPPHWRALRAAGPPEHWVRRVREAGLLPPQPAPATPTLEEGNAPQRAVVDGAGASRESSAPTSPQVPAGRRKSAHDMNFESPRPARPLQSTPASGQGVPAPRPRASGMEGPVETHATVRKRIEPPPPAFPSARDASVHEGHEAHAREASIREENLQARQVRRQRPSLALIFGTLVRRLERRSPAADLEVSVNSPSMPAPRHTAALPYPAPPDARKSDAAAVAVESVATLRRSMRLREIDGAAPRSHANPGSKRPSDIRCLVSRTRTVERSAANASPEWPVLVAAADRKRIAAPAIDWPTGVDDARWAELPDPAPESADFVGAAQQARARADDDMRREQARL